jgi:hypothetical protein
MCVSFIYVHSQIEMKTINQQNELSNELDMKC